MCYCVYQLNSVMQLNNIGFRVYIIIELGLELVTPDYSSPSGKVPVDLSSSTVGSLPVVNIFAIGPI